MIPDPLEPQQNIFYQTTNIWEDLLYMYEYIYTVYIVIMYLNLIIILKNERDFKTGYCM